MAEVNNKDKIEAVQDSGGLWVNVADSGYSAIRVAIVSGGGGGGGAAFSAGVSTMGNTLGSTGTVSQQIVFVGTNGITLSQSTGAGNATITISGAGAGGGSAIKALGVSNTGTTLGNTGVSTGIDWVVAASGNITASQSTAGGGPNTIWMSVPAQTTQPAVNAFGISNTGTTLGNTGTSSGITWVVAASGNVTASQSTAGGGPNTVWISVPAQTTQPAVNAFGVSNTGNTAGNTGTSSGITWVLGGSNANTLSQSTAGGGPNTIWIQGPVSATTISQVSTANAIGTRGSRFALEDHQHLGVAALAPGSNTGNTAGNTATQPGGTWVIAGSSPITISGSSGAAGIHTAWVQMSQTNQQMTLYATSNTTQSSTGTTNASSMIFAGAGVASVGITNGSVVISVPAGGGGGFSGGVSTGGNTAGSTGTVSNQVVYVGSNNITLSQSTGGASSATITILGPTLLSGGVSTDGNTAGSTGMVSNQLVFVGSNGITLSQSTGGASSGTLTIQGWPHISIYENMPGIYGSSLIGLPQTVSAAVAFQVPWPLSFSFMRMPILMTTSSTTIATLASATASASGELYSTWNAVLYSYGTGANSLSLRSITSGSAGFTFRNSISISNSTEYSITQGFSANANGGGTTRTTQYSISNTNYSFTTNQIATEFSSVRMLDIPFAASLPPGAFWAVVGMSTSTASAGAVGLSALTNCNVQFSAMYMASQHTLAMGIMGSTNRSFGELNGGGSFTTAGNATTASLPVSAITTFINSARRMYFQLLRSA